MKLTRKILNEHNIHNSYNLSQIVNDRKIFLTYIPADNGRLTAHYAGWKFIRIKEGGYYHKEFVVTCRENKQPVLDQAIAYVNRIHHINLTDRDVFGGYHPEGTLKRLEGIINKMAEPEQEELK